MDLFDLAGNIATAERTVDANADVSNYLSILSNTITGSLWGCFSFDGSIW